MTRLRRSAPAAVETPSGCVTAEKVALATGVWSAQVAELRRTVFVIPAHIVATEPSPGVLDEMGWQRGRPFADGRTAVHYGQRTGDDCLVFGRGGGRLGFAGRVIPTHYHDRPNAESIVADMRELFPATRALTVQWRWGGPVERTQHGFPWVAGWGRRATSTMASATAATASPPATSSGARWRRSRSSGTTTSPARRSCRTPRATCHPNRSASSRCAPCAPPSSATRCSRTRARSPTRSRACCARAWA